MRRNRLILTNTNAAIERPGAHYSIIYASLSIYPMPPSAAAAAAAAHERTRARYWTLARAFRAWRAEGVGLGRPLRRCHQAWTASPPPPHVCTTRYIMYEGALVGKRPPLASPSSNLIIREIQRSIPEPPPPPPPPLPPSFSSSLSLYLPPPPPRIYIHIYIYIYVPWPPTGGPQKSIGNSHLSHDSETERERETSLVACTTHTYTHTRTGAYIYAATAAAAAIYIYI